MRRKPTPLSVKDVTDHITYLFADPITNPDDPAPSLKLDYYECGKRFARTFATAETLPLLLGTVETNRRVHTPRRYW